MKHFKITSLPPQYRLLKPIPFTVDDENVASFSGVCTTIYEDEDPVEIMTSTILDKFAFLTVEEKMLHAYLRNVLQTLREYIELL